jgi:flagellar biosynthesis/type III secretory pathway chaperone
MGRPKKEKQVKPLLSIAEQKAVLLEQLHQLEELEKQERLELQRRLGVIAEKLFSGVIDMDRFIAEGQKITGLELKVEKPAAV